MSDEYMAILEGELDPELGGEDSGEPEGDPEDLDLEGGPILLDLGAVSDEPPAKGWHTVEIERAEYGLSRKKKLPQIFVLSRIIDEADPAKGRTIIWNLMLVGDGLLFTKRCFKALGYPEVLEYPSVEDLADSLVGLEIQVQVKHRVWKGEKQANVNSWRAIPALVF